MPRFEPFHYADSHGIWQITAKHKSGSVEAAVGALRRRNLMASFGVLGVLAVTMGLILMASQRARRLARLQMDFVAGISHELRTPLAVISSAAENIAHGVVEDKQQLVRYGNTIVKQSRQLTQLVEQVLLFAASQQSQRRYGLGPVNIAEVVDAALEGTSATVIAAGFTVERRVEAGLPPVNADFTALVQSLQNLITNAVKYGGENRWLRVSATAVKDKGRTEEVDLAVEDRGIGISKPEIKHIFEPFYRSPAVSESGIHGTGLGLPLARTIVEAMGGRLTAESELGKGSSFTIHLPVAEERGLKETQERGRQAGRRGAGFLFMTERILLVEDEEDLRMTLSDRLKAEGYALETAADGEEGLRKAVEGAYDLIVLDVMLPKKNGFDVCRDVRKAGIVTPIVMLTARGQLVDKVLGLKIGADDYLTKPFEVLELLARIEAHIRRGTAQPKGADVLQFGPIRIDLKGTTVFRNSKVVPLSAREFRLLRYFAQNPGTTLSREVLLKEVWGYNEDTFTRTVDVHVGSLRQKLEKDPKQPALIITVPGLGYKFVA